MEEVNDSLGYREGFRIFCLGFTVYSLVILKFFLLLIFFPFFFFFKMARKKRKTLYFKNEILINQIQNFMLYQSQLF